MPWPLPVRATGSFMVKNKMRKALEVFIKSMANYVAQSGDAIKIGGACFTTAAPKSTRELGPANGLHITVGSNTGEAIVQVNKKMENTLSYLIEYSISPAQNDQWVHVVPEKDRKLTLTKLKSLTAYDFRGAAVGSRGQVVYTVTITKTVL
jgi:hypothetical protein